MSKARMVIVEGQNIHIPLRWRKQKGWVRLESDEHVTKCCPDCLKKLGKVVAYVMTPVRSCGNCKTEVEG